MATESIIQGDFYFAGNLNSKTRTYPAGSISKEAIKAAAGIEASKLEHRHKITYYQPDGTDVADATVPIAIVVGAAGTLTSVRVVSMTAPTGGDKQFTVDVKVGNQSTAYASALSAPVAVTSSESDREVKSGTISSAALTAGDSIILVVDATGSSGSQGQGLIVVVEWNEDAA